MAIAVIWFKHEFLGVGISTILCNEEKSLCSPPQPLQSPPIIEKRSILNMIDRVVLRYDTTLYNLAQSVPSGLVERGDM